VRNSFTQVTIRPHFLIVKVNAPTAVARFPAESLDALEAASRGSTDVNREALRK